MRKLIPIIILSLITLVSPSCRRASHNGKIDGFWKITEIAYTPQEDRGENIVYPEDLFICVNLELLQLANPDTDITGILSCHLDEDRISVEFPTNPTEQKLYGYGFAGNPANLDILTLDSKHLVLRSSAATITCRRF
jgi:hypothetical protein